MPVEAKQVDGVNVVVISGRLVLGKDLDHIETLINDLIKQTPAVVVFDVSALDYADSAGIGTFVACLTVIRKSGGEMRLAGGNARMQRLFQITGIQSLMPMYPTVAAAAAG